MTDVWSERAEAYRNAPEQREGEDLDRIVEWARGSRTALDVASGGGHVTRRLREAGLEVVSADPAPGMQADVICPAEHLPFADGAFDLVVTRIAAAPLLGPPAGARRDGAGRARPRDRRGHALFESEVVEEAERLRDPTHVRSYSEDEWRSFLEAAGLEIEDVELVEKRHQLDGWLARSGTSEADGARVRELLADHIEGDEFVDRKILLNARKGRG